MRIENNDETIQRSIIEATEQRGIIPPEPAEASPRTEQEHEHVQIPANFWSFAPEHGYTDVDGSVTRERLERSGTLEDIDHRYDPPAPPAMSPQLKPSPNNNHQIASATTPSMLTTKADTGAADTEFGTECLQRKPSYMTPQELREGLEKDVDALKEIGEAQTREFKALEEKSDALRKVAKALREQLEAFLKNTQNQQEISKILAAIASNQAWSEATLLIYSKNQQELREARLENARLQEVAESRLKQARAQELAESRHSDAPRTGPSMITTPLHIEAVDPHSRPGSLLDESASLKKLTTYAAYTIKKCPPRDAKKERRRTLERVEEIWAQEDIIKKIKKLSESQQNVADKQAAVNHDVRRQITSLIDNLASAEFDTAFEWSLVQLDIIKEPVTSPRGKNLVSSRLYKSVTVFVKRTPRKDLNSCHFEGRLKPATAQQEQGFGDLKDLDDAWRKNAEDRDTKGPATKNRLARLQHIPSDDRLEDVVESSLSNSVGIESRERAEVPPTSCVDTESPSKLYNKWFEDYLKRPSIAQQCPIFEEKKSGSFDTIARYFEKTPKITEWRMDDLEALGVYCQRYVLPSKAIRDEIVRVLRKLGITFREYENLTAFEPEVTIPYGFTCHNRTKYQIFRICIVWIPAQGVNIIRSQNIDGGNVALYERMIDRISKLLRLQS
jgi:hypothetical protein